MNITPPNIIQNTDKKIALLIDGDNAQSKFIEDMLSEAGKHGKVTVRRIYGDWTDNKLNSWKEKINKYAVRPMQKFAFAKGKNSTDTAMIIDAMDILYSQTVTGFCIASSDSDYTGLAQRIRENGIFVMGIGEASKTTEAFVNACDIFVFTENLTEPVVVQKRKPDEKPRPVNKPDTARNTIKSRTETPKVAPVVAPVEVQKIAEKPELPRSRITHEPINLKLIKTAVDMVSDDRGFAYMGEIGIALRKLDPSFDPRTYGFGAITSLFKSLADYFEFEYRDGGSSVYIRLKKPL
jgi:uncharacterized LabA/DUF88 family protein